LKARAPLSLEGYASAELDLTHVLRAADLSERRRRGEVRPRIAQVHDVEHVGDFDAELKQRAPPERHVAEDADVDVSIPRSVDNAASGRSVRAQRGIRERRDVEPAFDQLV